MADVTRILNQIEQGDASASEKLLPLVYDELRVLARRRLANENPGQTLQATALVHEAYLRLVGSNSGSDWDGRAHFFASAAEAMRRILVDRARSRQSLKRGGGRERLEFDEAFSVAEPPHQEILALNEHLDALETVDSRAAELVKLRYFAGFTLRQAATILKISPRAADHLWSYAKAWLRESIESSQTK